MYKFCSIAISLLSLLTLNFSGTLVSIRPAYAVSWYNSSWSYRKEIIVDHTKVTATQSNFPVLISLTSDSNLASHARSDGFDILFTSSDGTTKLSHEREKYNNATGELEAWVKIPSLSSSSDTTIYMYYGNASSCDQTASACDATNNKTHVWDSNYTIVHHMNDTSGTTVTDSTSNANNGVKVSSSVPATTTGKIDGALNFDGSSGGYGSINSPVNLPTGDFTAQLWLNTATTGTDRYLFNDSDGLYLHITTGNKLSMAINLADGAIVSTSSINSSTWYYVAITRSGQNLSLYLNPSGGTPDSTDNNSNTISYTSGCGFLVGSDTGTDTFSGCNTGNGGLYMNGKLDEFRISKIARTSSWIQTEYNNENSPSTFYSVGSEEGNQFLSSTTYEMTGYDFGSGGKLNNTSTTYSLYGNTGQVDGLTLNSTNYSALPGLTYLLSANVPPAPSISNPDDSSNKLSLTLNTGSNPSDTVYAIAISPDGFTSTTNYVQADDTISSTPVWQTNAVWGASGFNVIGLTNGTTYTVKVSAKQGTYTQSSYGPTASAATLNTTFSYSINSNSLTFPALDPGTVQTSTSTVTVTVTTAGAGGATVAAYDSNAGLLSSNTSYTINSGTADLSSASEGYGLRATAVGQTSGGPMESLSPYNGSGNNVGVLDSSKRNVFDSSGASVTSGTGTFQLQAKAGPTAKAATDYGDIITVIASATF